MTSLRVILLTGDCFSSPKPSEVVSSKNISSFSYSFLVVPYNSKIFFGLI